MADERQFITFYGIDYTDWKESFGVFSNWTTLLTREYISDACDTVESSAATITHNFLYPFHIKKIYWVEGRIEGEICVSTYNFDSTCSSYQVSLWKVHGTTNEETQLATTGWVAVNDTLVWDEEFEVGDEAVYHFYIDQYNAKEITEHERIYFKVEVNGIQTQGSLLLMHSNDPKWTDCWIKVPFRL